MQFRIEPNPEETRRACQAIAVASLPPSRRSGVMVLLYAVIVAAAFVLPPSRPLTVVIGVGAVLATEVLLRMEAQSRVRGLQASDPHATEPHFIEVGADGLRAWCAHVDTRYTWDGTTGIRETPEFYLFLRGSGVGLAIPKRLLDAEGDAELRRRLRDWAPAFAGDLGDRGAPVGAAAT
jgi:hypothetical protein